LLSRINQRHYGLTKSVKTLSSASPATPTPPFPLPIATGAALPTAHLTPKDSSSISKIQAEWVKIENLQDEKIKLAERLERIVSRARDRGKVEWRKVGGMDIDELETDVKLGDLGGADVLLPTSGLGSGSDSGRRRKKGTPALSLAAAISAGNSMGAIGSPAGSMAPPPVPRAGSQGRSGSSRRDRAERHQSQAVSEPEPEPEAMEIEAEADDALYCFCQQKSYGEMVGCDAPAGHCKYEWVSVDGDRLTALTCSSTSSVSVSPRPCPRPGSVPTASRHLA
jgi:chromatin modification-related protein YNG2